MTEQNFLTTSEKKSYDVVNNKVDPKIGSQDLSRPNFDQLKRNLVRFINTMI